MNVEIMTKATEHGKPIWDTLIAIGGAIGIFLQSALAVEIQMWAQILGGFGLGIFTLVRAYYWIKNDGYEDKKP